MKKYLLFLCITSCITSYTFSQVKYWDGEGGDGLWSTAANWTDNTIPLVTDNVVIDNSLVAGSYTVTLPSGAVTITVLSLAITPALGSTIVVVVPITNTAVPGLSVTGPGDGVIINDRGVIRNASGASSGAAFEVANTFRINNGGRYIHNTNRASAALVTQLSVAAGTEEGVFEFDVPAASYTIPLTGRNYGTLILSAATRGTTVTYSGNGISPCTVRGDLIVRTTVNFSLGMSADFIVRRNLQQAAPSVFNLQNLNNNNRVSVQGNITAAGTITELGSGLPILELNGTSGQQLTMTGTINNSVTLRINNVQGVTLAHSLILPYRLALLQGNIRTDATSVLTLVDNATVIGGSENSFVDGPMRKIGDDNFIFPIGKGELFSPIGIVNVSGQVGTDVFTAEYQRANPQTAIGNGVVAGMDHISFVEYWSLIRDQGTSVKRVSLSITPSSFCHNATDTYVSRWNGSLWANEGSTNTGIVPVGIYETATITSTANQSAFGNFTLITDQPFIDNPLPLRLLSFSVVKADAKVVLHWQIAESCAGAVSIAIERATGGGAFTKIGTVSCAHTSFEDLYPVADINRYRLKITAADGATKYSHIETVIVEQRNTAANISLVAITRTNLSLVVIAEKQQSMDIHIVNSAGNRVYTAKETVIEGTTTVSLRLPELPAGVYYIYGNVEKGRTNVLKVGLR